MAKRKSDIAPANSAIPSADAIDQWIGDIGANLADVTEKCGKAYDEGQSRGFETQLAASQALNVNWNVLGAWSPLDVRVTGDKDEDRIRTAHAMSEPQSAWATLNQVKVTLGMLSDACEASTVDHVRKDLKRNILPVQSKGATPATGVAKLQAAIVDARSAKDTKRESVLKSHLAAVGDVDKIVDLCKSALLVEKAHSRWRVRLYLALVAPMMKAGGVPNADYEQVCGVAGRAHKSCNKLDKQAHTGGRVRATVEEAVTTWIAETYGTQAKDKRSNLEVGMAAALSIFPAARRAAKANVISEEVRDHIIRWLENGAGIEDPDVTRANAAFEKREAKKLAKEASGKASGKTAAKPSTGKGKAKKDAKPKAAPKKARVTPAAPSSKVTPSTDATDDAENERVLADLTT